MSNQMDETDISNEISADTDNPDNFLSLRYLFPK
jgi:hypothetical protein